MGGALLCAHAATSRRAARPAVGLDMEQPMLSPRVTPTAAGSFRYQMKTLVLLAAVVMFATGCGATGIGSGANPTPRPGEGMGFDVTATDTDHAITMRVGQKLEVVLHAPNGMNDWTHPVSNDTSVLSPVVDPAATAARGVTLAAFEATKQGQADVSANASPRCSPGQPCPMFLAVYSLKVTITP